MTASDQKKIQNLMENIGAIEDKVEKLMTQRNIYALEIQRIQQKPERVTSKPTETERQEQSRRDKEAYQTKFAKAQVHMKRMKLD